MTSVKTFTVYEGNLNIFLTPLTENEFCISTHLINLWLGSQLFVANFVTVCTVDSRFSWEATVTGGLQTGGFSKGGIVTLKKAPSILFGNGAFLLY